MSNLMPQLWTFSLVNVDLHLPTIHSAWDGFQITLCVTLKGFKIQYFIDTGTEIFFIKYALLSILKIFVPFLPAYETENGPNWLHQPMQLVWPIIRLQCHILLSPYCTALTKVHKVMVEKPSQLLAIGPSHQRVICLTTQLLSPCPVMFLTSLVVCQTE